MLRLPIVERELRVGSRLWQTYWGRAATAGLALLIAGTVYYTLNEHLATRELSQALFGTLSSCLGLHALLCGPLFAADCLSRERREDTLGLLFLTSLKPWEILAGKLAATSLRAIYALAAAVPVLALPLLMGGVGLGEFLRVTLVIANALLLSLAAGLACSAVFKTAQNSVGWCAIFLGVITIGLPVFDASGPSALNRGQAAIWLLPSPSFAFVMAWNYAQHAAAFWLSNLCLLTMSVMLLGLAGWALPRAWRDRPATPIRRRGREIWRNLLFGPPPVRESYRRAALDVNAFFWLITRQRLKPRAMWWMLAFLVLLWLTGAVVQPKTWFQPENYLFSAALLTYLFRLLLIVECAQPLAEARQLNALELLLSTPLGLREILHGQWRALRQDYRGPLLAKLGIIAVLFWACTGTHEMRRDTAQWRLLWAGGFAVFVVDMVAIYWAGLWRGLTARNSPQAQSSVIFLVLVLPWVFFGGLVMGAAAFVEFGLRRPFNPPDKLLALFWLVISLTWSASVAWFYSRRLRQQFREAAAQRHPPRQWFWRRSEEQSSPTT